MPKVVLLFFTFIYDLNKYNLINMVHKNFIYNMFFA